MMMPPTSAMLITTRVRQPVGTNHFQLRDHHPRAAAGAGPAGGTGPAFGTGGGTGGGVGESIKRLHGGRGKSREILRALHEVSSALNLALCTAPGLFFSRG